ncbi:twin-arginine translocase TatA/TatE family subunit [candidate division KSB1 bacterium]|nr:twin-arginine translocase TatA/TatE family subunit [candidate division KSB1 bacterium]RQW00427.1 MAG: twin-arginine translocase TatA/TatE family subunit [candidate division KSB1 bacterium]
MWTPGIQELLVILFVVLLIFGGKKLPELAKGLGKGIKEFKKAQYEEETEPKEKKEKDTISE